MTKTTVVVVTWRGRERIGACLAALDAQDRPHRTLVVDNASTDGTSALLDGREVLRLPVNAGYAGGLAAALARVQTEYMAWLNDDAVPEPGWLAALETALDEDADVAAAGATLLRADGGVQSAGTALTADGYGYDRGGDGGEAFGFCGGAALLRTGVLRAVGGVPAEFFCYYEDTDTAWRLRLAGYRVLAVPGATAWHAHGASTGIGSPRFHRWNEENRLRMLLRCAPARVAAVQLAKFVLLLFGRTPRTPNYAPALRLRVLAALGRDGWLLAAQRLRIARMARVPRDRVWRAWAGQEPLRSAHRNEGNAVD